MKRLENPGQRKRRNCWRTEENNLEDSHRGDREVFAAMGLTRQSGIKKRETEPSGKKE